MEGARAKEPFVFYTRLHLKELTGFKATDLAMLLSLIKTVPGSSIYYHTHHFLQQHQFLSPEPPNDFAYWVREVLGADLLSEKLASIDTVQYHTIRSLREKLAQTIEEHLQGHPEAAGRRAADEEAFHFMKAVSFILPTPYVAYTLEEFTALLEKVSVHSLYFHVFEARLRLEKATNDFALWIEQNFADHELSRQLIEMDPYTYTLESLRTSIIQLIREWRNHAGPG